MNRKTYGARRQVGEKVVSRCPLGRPAFAPLCSEITSLTEELSKVRTEIDNLKHQRNAMIKRCHEQIAFAKAHATVVSFWMCEREYQGMIDACEEILAASEAAKEE